MSNASKRAKALHRSGTQANGKMMQIVQSGALTEELAH